MDEVSSLRSQLQREIDLSNREKKMLQDRIDVLQGDLDYERERVRELERLLSASAMGTSPVRAGLGYPQSYLPPVPSTSGPSAEFCEAIRHMLAGTTEETAIIATELIAKLPQKLRPREKSTKCNATVLLSAMIGQVPGVGSFRLPPPYGLHFYMLPVGGMQERRVSGPTSTPPRESLGSTALAGAKQQQAQLAAILAHATGGQVNEDTPTPEFCDAALRILDAAGARDRATSLLANQIMHKMLADGRRNVLPPHESIVQGTPSGWCKKGIMGIWLEGVPGVGSIRLQHPTPEPRFFLLRGGFVQQQQQQLTPASNKSYASAASHSPQQQQQQQQQQQILLRGNSLIESGGVASSGPSSHAGFSYASILLREDSSSNKGGRGSPPADKSFSKDEAPAAPATSGKDVDPSPSFFPHHHQPNPQFASLWPTLLEPGEELKNGETQSLPSDQGGWDYSSSLVTNPEEAGIRVDHDIWGHQL